MWDWCPFYFDDDNNVTSHSSFSFNLLDFDWTHKKFTDFDNKQNKIKDLPLII